MNTWTYPRNPEPCDPTRIALASFYTGAEPKRTLATALINTLYSVRARRSAQPAKFLTQPDLGNKVHHSQDLVAKQQFAIAR